VLADGAADITQVQPQQVQQIGVTTTFSDGTFPSDTWNTTTFQSVNSVGISLSESQALSGGNPGAYYSFGGSLANFNGSTQYIRQTHFTASAVYNPATSGAITFISGGFSQGSFVNNNNVIFETGLVLRQNGNLYWSSNNFGYGLQGAVGWYGSSTLYQLSSSSQWNLIGGSSHPDFTASGAPISFGFWTGYYYWNGPGTVSDGVDNWTVSISSGPVPEPAGAGIVLVAGMSLGARRARANRMWRFYP
jgi:hypothetical protein